MYTRRLLVASGLLIGCGGAPAVAPARMPTMTAAHCPVPTAGTASGPPTASLTQVPLEAGRVGVRVHATAPVQVESVRVYVEGRHVATKAVCAKEKDLDIEVPVIGSTTRVTAYAFDSAGAASTAATLDLPRVEAPPHKPDVWIVAAGVDTYPKLPAGAALQGAVRDARTLAAAFHAQASEGKPFGNAHESILLEAGVTASTLRAALEGLSAMGEDDLAIVSLSGHGMKANAGNETYFLTSESGPSTDIAKTGVAYADIAEPLAKAKGHVLVLVDTSYAGGFGQGDVSPSAALADRLEREHRAGVIVFAASKTDEVGYEAGTKTRGLPLVFGGMQTTDASPAPNGSFTASIVTSLASRSTDTNHDGAIQMSELIAAVADSVPRLTAGKQNPVVVRREQLGDFTVASAPSMVR